MPSHSRTKPRKATIPAFTLYGDAQAAPVEMLHVEAIQSRSSLYRWEIDIHTHHGLHQILWVQSGPADVTLDTITESCHGPVAVAIPPGVVHAFRFSQETDGHVLTFNPRAVLEGDVPATGDALRDLFSAPRVLHLERDAPSATRIATLFKDLFEEIAAPDASHSPVPLWLARAIVWRLAHHAARLDKRATHSSRAAQALYTRFLVLVEAHHREHWAVSRYASQLGLSVESLNRLTRAESGQAALDLIHERLAREASRRLAYIAAPIAQLAMELGFDDPAYFCRFFKRRTGRSPREFRQSLSHQTND
jgi:AraC family transcriptional regulator, transcriptional activator of pobA